MDVHCNLFFFEVRGLYSSAKYFSISGVLAALWLRLLFIEHFAGRCMAVQLSETFSCKLQTYLTSLRLVPLCLNHYTDYNY